MIDTTSACEGTTAKTQSIKPYVIEFVTGYVGYFIASILGHRSDKNYRSRLKCGSIARVALISM